MDSDSTGRRSGNSFRNGTGTSRRGVGKLRGWVETSIEVVVLSASMVFDTLRAFWNRGVLHPNLIVASIYAPFGLLATSYLLLYLGGTGGVFDTQETLLLAGVIAVVPVLGLAAEFAREEFLPEEDVGGGFDLVNLVVVGTEVGVMYLTISFLSTALVGHVGGGVTAFLPSNLVVPMFGVINDVNVPVDTLIVLYVFPSMVVFYLHDEKLLDLWPPGQLTPIVVDREYVSLFIAWTVITRAITELLQFLNVYVGTAPGESLPVRFVALLMIISIFVPVALFLTLFAITHNASSVSSLSHKTTSSRSSTTQSSLGWFSD